MTSRRNGNTQQVEDEGRLADWMAKVAKRVGGGLHAVVVVIDGEISLSHRMKFVAQLDGARGFVRLEEVVDGNLELAGCRIGGIHGEVKDGILRT